MKTSNGGGKVDLSNPNNFRKAFEQAVRQVQESHELQRQGALKIKKETTDPIGDDGKVTAPKMSTKPRIAMGSPVRKSAAVSRVNQSTHVTVNVMLEGEENVAVENESGHVQDHLSKMASKIQAARVRRFEDATRGGLMQRKSHDFKTSAINRPNTSLFKTSLGPKASLLEHSSPSKKNLNFNEKKTHMADHLFYGVGIQRKASANRTAGKKENNKSIDGTVASKKATNSNTTANIINSRDAAVNKSVANSIMYDSVMDKISALHSQHNNSIIHSSSNKSPKRIIKTRNQ